MTDVKELMSDSLVDKFDSNETFSYIEKVFLCNISFIVLDKTEDLLGVVEGFEPCDNDQTIIKVKISTDDAFSISEVWKTARIKSYNLTLKGQIILHDGVFRILKYKILNVDTDKSICSVSFELVKE